MNLRDQFDEGVYTNHCVYDHKDKYLKKVYALEELRIITTFNEDACKFLREAGVPEKSIPKVYEKAWDTGHSVGFSEIINELEKLADLFR
jgi:hypothetical protein